MNKSILFILRMFLLSMFISSCEKNPETTFSDVPVLQGYLIENSPVKLNISRMQPFDSANAKYSSDDINNLSVHLSDGTATYTLTPVGDGNYANSSIIVRTGKTYTLSFEYAGKTITATTSVPSKPVNYQQSVTEITVSPSFSPGTAPPESVELTWDNPDNSYYLVVAVNYETNPEAINSSGIMPSISFINQPTQGESTTIQPMLFKYYGNHHLILYHINTDYAALYNNNSSTTSQNLQNPSTSIENGYGIFTGISTDTLNLLVKKG